MRKVSLLATAMLLAAPISAQAFYVPTNTPGSGTCNVIPFGTNKTSATWVNQLYQTVVTDADLGTPAGPLTICDVAFASCNTQIRGFDELKVTMGQLPGGILTSTFANNLVNNVQVVLDVKNYAWPVTGGAWTDIGLTNLYTYIPGQGDLVIEILAIGNDVLGGSSSGFHRDTRPRAYATTWVGTPPTSGSTGSAALIMRLTSGLASIGNYGIGCGAGPLAINATGSSQLGQTFTLQVTNGPANQPGAINIGFFLVNIDLTPLQMPGCTMYNAISVPVPVALDATGSSVLVPVTVPQNPALICARTYAQGVAIEPNANPLGVSASDYVRAVTGN